MSKNDRGSKEQAAASSSVGRCLCGCCKSKRKLKLAAQQVQAKNGTIPKNNRLKKKIYKLPLNRESTSVTEAGAKCSMVLVSKVSISIFLKRFASGHNSSHRSASTISSTSRKYSESCVPRHPEYCRPSGKRPIFRASPERWRVRALERVR